MEAKRKTVFATAALLAFLLAVVTALQAHAGTVQLTLAGVSGTPGRTLTVSGTITNNSSVVVYLNGENFTLSSSSFLNGDTTDFFLNAPLSLDAGTNSGSIALFTFDVVPGTAPGTYFGNFLDIIGGGPSDFTEVLASAEFSVDVQAATPTPEPGWRVLMMIGSLVVGTYLLRRRTKMAD